MFAHICEDAGYGSAGIISIPDFLETEKSDSPILSDAVAETREVTVVATAQGHHVARQHDRKLLKN